MCRCVRTVHIVYWQTNPVLVYCWPDVCDDGPTSNQHRVNRESLITLLTGASDFWSEQPAHDRSRSVCRPQLTHPSHPAPVTGGRSKQRSKEPIVKIKRGKTIDRGFDQRVCPGDLVSSSGAWRPNASLTIRVNSRITGSRGFESGDGDLGLKRALAKLLVIFRAFGYGV